MKKEKIAHNGKEAIELLKKAKKGETIVWDEKTESRVIKEKFIK